MMTQRRTMSSSPVQKNGYRPIYENKETEGWEQRFKGEFEGVFPDLRLRKLPRSYNLDFAVWNKNIDQIIALIEYKQRRYSSSEMNRMGGIKISLNKIKHSLEYADLFEVPVRLIYRLSDNKALEYFRFDVTKENVRQCKIDFIDLVSRGDTQDVEPSLVIPMALFKLKSLQG